MSGVEAEGQGSEKATLKIGKYFLSYFDGAKGRQIWLGHESGESMSCDVERVEKLLDVLWAEF